jgi:hypothetical protein
VKIKKLQRQSFVSSLSASRVVRAGNELGLGLTEALEAIIPNDEQQEQHQSKATPAHIV